MSEMIIYENNNGEIKIDVTFEDENLWLSSSEICEVFGKAKATISEHIGNIFEEKELERKAVVRKFRTTASDGKNYDVSFYNLDMIIAIGYRVKSSQGTIFRQWATKRLNEYITKGFALNDEVLKSGNSMVYFDELQSRLRDIRISERFFYQKIKDIYMTSKDYNPSDEKTINFFKIVQNKLLWAVSSKTASELVYSRVDISLPLLGMSSFDKEKKNITKKDVSIAKNYLNSDEIKLLGLLVEQYLAFAEVMAKQQKIMTMKNWVDKLDDIINLNGRELLKHYGKITHKLALEKSELEYKKYKEEKKKLEKKQSFEELENDIKRLK